MALKVFLSSFSPPVEIIIMFHLCHHGFAGFRYINLPTVLFFFPLINCVLHINIASIVSSMPKVFIFLSVHSIFIIIRQFYNVLLWLQAIGQNGTTCNDTLRTPCMVIFASSPFTLKSLKLLIMELKSQSFFSTFRLLKEMFPPDYNEVATQGCERLAAFAPN